MNDIILATLIVGIIGIVFGLLLAFASVIFKVEVDERIEQINEVLPGANCGACGFAGCSGYAQAIVEDDAPVNSCSVGKAPVANKIAEIMGKTTSFGESKVARVLCVGDCNKAKEKYEYLGIADCNAANRLAGGAKACQNGCLGLGSCQAVCKFDAISIVDGIAKVDEEKCIGCGMCVKACPKNIIELFDKSRHIAVLCCNTKPAKEVMAVCSAGCIDCKICEKNCPFEAITVVNNLARIDYDKCKVCGICATKCPKNVICKTR